MVNYLWDNIFKKDKGEQEVIKVIGDCYLFSTLTRKELAFVHNMVHVRTYRPGEPVFRQGELGVGMYIIMKGSVDITVETQSPGEGLVKNVFVTRLNQGDFFGEISLVEIKGRRTATAVSRDESKLIGFFKPDLDQIIARNPATGVKIVHRLAEVLGGRLKETSDKLSELKRDLQRMNKPANP